MPLPPASLFANQLLNSLLLLLILLLLLLYVLRIRCNKQVGDTAPPGSLGLPFLGETLQFMAAINTTNGVYHFVRTRCLRYGACFKTSIFGQTHVFVSTTDSAKLILSDDAKFSKRYMRSIAQLVGHSSLLCASDHMHHKLLRRRLTLTNIFSPASLNSFLTNFDKHILYALRRWDSHTGSGTTIFLLHEALKISCKAMWKMLMSLESEQEIERLHKDVGEVCQAMLAFPWRFPGTRFHNALKARKRIIQVIDKEIRERRRAGCHREDLLHRLLMEDGMTQAEIEDNIVTMIIAGQDTTASAITWMVKFLDDNPHVLQILRKEQLQILSKQASRPTCYLTLEDLGNMTYAAKVVKESLRMASVVPWFPRVALEDCEIEGYKIKRGWNVNIDVRSVHSDPIVYKNPSMFDPSRFDEEVKAFGFLGFGMGGRQCVGMNMAKGMMMVFLHRMLTTYSWKLMDSDSTIDNSALFSKLKSGCPLLLTRLHS